MKNLLSGLIVYKNMNRGEILHSLAYILEEYKTSKSSQVDFEAKNQTL